MVALPYSLDLHFKESPIDMNFFTYLFLSFFFLQEKKLMTINAIYIYLKREEGFFNFFFLTNSVNSISCWSCRMSRNCAPRSRETQREREKRNDFFCPYEIQYWYCLRVYIYRYRILYSFLFSLCPCVSVSVCVCCILFFNRTQHNMMCRVYKIWETRSWS